MDKIKSGTEMARVFGDFCNSYGIDKIGFAEGMMSEHRTLQQSAFGVMLECIKAWAEMYEAHRYDDRNKTTCEICYNIWNTFKEDLYLPFI